MWCLVWGRIMLLFSWRCIVRVRHQESARWTQVNYHAIIPSQIYRKKQRSVVTLDRLLEGQILAN